MSQRKGAYSGRGSASSKKKKSGGAAHSAHAHRPAAAAAAAASSAHRSAPHRAYFPANTEEAQQRAGAKTPAMRSRANSIAEPQRTSQRNTHSTADRRRALPSPADVSPCCVCVCSCAVFGDPFFELRLRVDSPEPHLAQANLVLSALDASIDESLQAAGRPVESKSATDYYGAIMVSLEQHDQHSTENLGALLYLLSQVLPSLPPGLLKKPLERIAAVLIAVIKSHASVDHIAKHVLKCCAHLLHATALESHALWSPTSHSPSVVTMMQMMLVYSPDQRPPIRRAAQEGVRETLKGMYEHSVSAAAATSGAGGAVPVGIPKGACDTVVNFCIREISHCTPRDCQVVLYLCGLLQGCIQYLSVSASAQILEAILSLVGRGNNILMVQAMRTVDAFFMHGSEIHMPAEGVQVEANSAEAKARDKFLKLASKLLTVLLTLKPHQNDQLATAAYLNTLKVGLVRFMGGLESNAGSQANFAQILATSYDKIPELLSLIAEGLLSPKVDVVKGSTKAMGEILRKTLTPGMIEQSMREAAHAASLRGHSAVVPPFYRVIELMENLLGYRYKSEWNRILLLVAELFHATTGMQSAQQLLVPMLKKLDALHVESQGEIASEDPALDYRPSLDEAIGAAIQSFGPEAILTVLPLDLPLDFYSKNQHASLHELLQGSRSWLLPLFRSYITSGSLEFFSSFFISIANQLHDLEKQSNARGKHLEGRAFQALKISVWDIFPSLCSSLPNDIAQSFKKQLKTLINVHLLQDDMGFDHAAICRGLGNMLRKLKEIVAAAADTGATQHKKHTKRDGSDAEDDEAKDTFGVDLDDDDSAAEDDSDDEDVLAKAKAIRKAKKAKAEAAAASAAATSAKAASAASSSRVVGSRRPAPYTAAQAQSLLYDTIAPTSEHVLPVLFNRAAMPSEKHREAIFEAIAQFASITESELLNKHFKKVLRMLLEHSMAQNKEKAAAEGSMADAGAASAPSNAKSQAAQRTHMLTDIVAALCVQSSASLSAENLDYLYKILKSQLSADLDQMDAGLQKKVYKILAGLCSQHPTFFNGRWKEIIADLAAASGNLHPAALKQRLACVRHVLLFLPELMLKDKSAISMLPGFLGEVILACKEITAKTRDYAFSVLLELGHKMRTVEQARKEASGMAGHEIFGALSQPLSDQPLMTEFVYMITAGLAGTSNHMQSASVLCLARVLYEFKDVLGSKIVGQILDLVLPLFESKSRELIKSLLTFIKVCVLTFDNDALVAHLPAIVGGLVLWCHEKKNRFKPKIKVLFEILMRKVGVDPVRELVPDQHTALIEHIRKSKEREKRIKTEHWKNSKKGAGDDEEGDGTSHKPREDYESIMRDDELAAEDAASSAPAAPKQKQKGGQKSGKDVNPLWIRDEADVDFMDAQNVVSKVTASNPKLDAQQKRGAGVALGHGVAQDAGTGKLVIAGGSKGAAGLSGAAAAAMLDVEALDSEIRAKHKDKRKRQAEEEDDEGEEEHAVKKQQLPGQQFRVSGQHATRDRPTRAECDSHACVPLCGCCLSCCLYVVRQGWRRYDAQGTAGTARVRGAGSDGDEQAKEVHGAEETGEHRKRGKDGSRSGIHARKEGTIAQKQVTQEARKLTRSDVHLHVAQHRADNCKQKTYFFSPRLDLARSNCNHPQK